MGQVSSKCFGFTLKVETCATSPQLQATKHVKCVVIGETQINQQQTKISKI
jgi:hypothetical protein